MSTNQPGKPRIKPGEDIDTTEGHATRPGRAAKAGRVEDADTEGHGRRGVPSDESVNRDIDSTEGHIVRPGRVDEADTESHLMRGRGVEPAGDDDDTEGHPFRK